MVDAHEEERNFCQQENVLYVWITCIIRKITPMKLILKVELVDAAGSD